MPVELRWNGSGIDHVLQYCESRTDIDERRNIQGLKGDWTNVPTVTIHPEDAISDSMLPIVVEQTVRDIDEDQRRCL